MAAATPKVFLPLGSQPMVVYCLRTLSGLPGLTALVLVVAADRFDLATRVLDEYGPWPVPVRVVGGGVERQDSVAAGLAATADDADLVLVHDAARPFVARSAVEACVAAAAASGAAIVAEPARDTVKLADSTSVITRTLDRRTVWLAQTPQVFRTSLLRSAYDRARREGFLATDDAALVERIGAPVCIVEGNATNRKITTPDDLRWAEWYLREILMHDALPGNAEC
jgi:2-C-methyl-D-erythritol 4-phosphate cytidylyltransferase